MSNRVDIADYRRMANLLYQVHHGHIIVNAEGRPYLLDTGAPFSVGYEPVRIAGRTFPSEYAYMGVTASCLTQRVGVPLEGLIGADILKYFNLGIYATERMVQFSQQPACGDVLVPVQDHMGVPIVSVRVGGRVRRVFLDTGASMSYLLPEAFKGLTPEGRFEDSYPLLGEFLTDVYPMDVVMGGVPCTLRFGVLPDELRSLLVAGGVEGILGTELLRYFALNLSMRDRVLSLELPHSLVGLAAG